jgi:hypothetical protein
MLLIIGGVARILELVLGGFAPEGGIGGVGHGEKGSIDGLGETRTVSLSLSLSLLLSSCTAEHASGVFIFD